MIKKVKRIVSMSMLICSLTISHTAKANVISPDTFLQQHGVPDEIISILSETEKQELTQYRDLKFAGYSSSVSDMECENSNKTRGTISSTKMSLTGWGFTYTQSGRKYLEFTSSYDWLSEPFYYLGDQIGITWDSSVFEPVDGGQWVSCTYTDRYNSQVGEIIYPGLSFYNSYDKYDSSASSVIFDVKMYGNSHSFGSCTVKLRLKSGVSAPSSTQLYYKYGHSKYSYSPSLSIGASSSGLSGGISFSATKTCDHRADFTTVNCSWN